MKLIIMSSSYAPSYIGNFTFSRNFWERVIFVRDMLRKFTGKSLKTMCFFSRMRNMVSEILSTKLLQVPFCHKSLRAFIMHRAFTIWCQIMAEAQNCQFITYFGKEIRLILCEYACLGAGFWNRCMVFEVDLHCVTNASKQETTAFSKVFAIVTWKISSDIWVSFDGSTFDVWLLVRKCSVMLHIILEWWRVILQWSNIFIIFNLYFFEKADCIHRDFSHVLKPKKDHHLSQTIQLNLRQGTDSRYQRWNPTIFAKHVTQSWITSKNYIGLLSCC